MTALRILHVLGQRPEMTGSGIYLEALIGESRKHGISCFRVVGIPAGSLEPLAAGSSVDTESVLFDSVPLDFPVVGMSDVMPYRSSLFSELKGRRLTAYKAEFIRVLEAAVNRFHPHLLHTNHLFLLSALARKRFPNLPMVTTCHGTDLRQVELCPHLRSFVRRYCRRIDKIIALSADQKADIQQVYDVSEKSIAVIGGGYDDTIFTRGPQRSTEGVELLYAGKLNRSKGVPWLLRSLMKITDLDWHLHLAGSGSGPEYDECIELTRHLGDRVSLHGYISHRCLADLMKRVHIQILPSFFEGLPLVLFEGLASGCRVIATELPGFREIFGKTRRDTVRLVPLPPLETIDRPYQKDEPGLVEVLSNSLVDMIATVNRFPDVDDPQAEAIAADYTWSRVFERTFSVYKEMVSP
ncbi:glycoside hydrolase [Desulfosarcina widdelii]|uniref:Glycoside hydrolase n=1 Tax=Desulfosarcina widdelii TaxID=947919 RepID=A0A5K7Z9W8_9BACT|nr:glycosyltransferase family 4 protein [Desulfosarcina widdelii]BBO78646.1 glycoside hydrolase [Desulfosarcina widdelii]